MSMRNAIPEGSNIFWHQSRVPGVSTWQPGGVGAMRRNLRLEMLTTWLDCDKIPHRPGI
jgi:hypothetical protein